MSAASPQPTPLWQPSEVFKQATQLNKYRHWLQENYHLNFADYQSLWEWSVENTAAFWESVWEYFQIISHSPYTTVHNDDPMPETKWFPGSTLNYAEHIFREKTTDHPAIIFRSERHPLTEISWETLEKKVAAFKTWLKQAGVKEGDRVVAFLPNIPEATIAFLAVNALGAIWSSCSPDFGVNSVVDRFAQISPKVLIAVDGYQYGGKSFDKNEAVQSLFDDLPSLEKLVMIPYLNEDLAVEKFPDCVLWETALETPAEPLTFASVPFDHPIWVLYSSGTTGIPKAITHSHGGVLLEHYKYLAFHNDVHPGERFFWFSTTGWMMWNFVQAALLAGASIVLYDGSPGFPDLEVLWEFAAEAGIDHFGTSAPFIVACMKAGQQPGKKYDLKKLRSIGSTGAPLPPEGFDWIYENISEDVWLCSMSGGTDVCTAFVGGCPLEPVYRGEIQCRALGCSMYSYDEMGEPALETVGEMVITKPMPSMPIYFWNDPGKARYLASYFEMYAGIWRHGDWLKITERNSLIIYGRSDATLNRQGIRIGTAEIYRAIDKVPGIADSLIVNLELEGGEHYMPLFVVLNDGAELDDVLKQAIKKTLRQEYTPRHVPDEVIEIQEIPYTISGKKLEAPVKKILLGIPIEKAANPDSMKNPDSLQYFLEFRKRLGLG